MSKRETAQHQQGSESGEFVHAPPPLWQRLLVGLVLIVLCCLCFAVAHLAKLLEPKPGEHSAQTSNSPIRAMTNLTQVVFDPRAGFPGKSHVNILVMGIDDNWTDQNVLYTKNARTDTLFLLTADLDRRKCAVMSLPRDSYVPIAGTDYSDKINSAYASGGPERTVATFAHLTGVFPDYYVVLNIDATKRLVDALGGVNLTVEHQMDYDDNWGHLHVHLKPGYQHLDGDQALSFVRYRHGNHGLAAEDGDPRRIYRQHVLLRAMIDKAKTFGAAVNSETLVNTAMSCVETNLSRTQIADLTRMFKDVRQDDVTTAQITGADARGADGAWLIVLDPVQVRDFVSWLVKGNEPAMWGITPVYVKGDSTNADRFVQKLQLAGFTETAPGRSHAGLGPESRIVDTGVPDPLAAYRIAQVLGLNGSSVIRRELQPNSSGWTPPADITVYPAEGT